MTANDYRKIDLISQKQTDGKIINLNAYCHQVIIKTDSSNYETIDALNNIYFSNIIDFSTLCNIKNPI